MVRKVEVIPYNPIWASMFMEESARLAWILASEIVASRHIGSTAIPGILAKPVVDILLEVKEIQIVDSYNDQLIALGYQPRGENGIPGRRYFIKEINGVRIYHVHTFQTGNPEIARHINFRDYLIAHPAEAQAYSQLKVELAREYSQDINSYVEGKTDFIRSVDEKARAR